MTTKMTIPPIRILPEELANKIAAGEVVERPASVVKELVENALDAKATRIIVRIVAAGRRTIEVLDNGHGMSENDALMAIERHATSKIRKAEDLDCIRTLGFRGEALASIAAVSRFEMLTRREKDNSATQVRVDGGILRDVSQVAGPVGTRITVNRLYFNTPVRAKFLKGITTELSHCVDCVQRHALAHEGVSFQLFHNDKPMLDVPANARLRERVALIWGLNFAKDMLEADGEQAGFKIRALIGAPGLTRSQRSHQFFFLNGRPVVNRSLQYGLEDGYRGLLTIGRRPVGIVFIDTHPRFVDVNIHPTKREVRFRDERAAHDALRDVIRERLAAIEPAQTPPIPPPHPADTPAVYVMKPEEHPTASAPPQPARKPSPFENDAGKVPVATTEEGQVQTEISGIPTAMDPLVAPEALYEPIGHVAHAPLQVFDTYLIVPEGDRLLIIDQHALHERLTYDNLRGEVEDRDYAAQQLAVPLLVDVPPSHTKLLESNIGAFAGLGIHIEPFGGNTFQVTGICHLYDESKVPDIIYRVLDEIAQGDLFDREQLVSELLRLAVEACRSSVKAGDRLTPEERSSLLDGFRRLRPPYTCPHGRPIITEITQRQMEKSFKRIQ
ncbi:MAG: DNA mismatch repair endonuclease MutL [Nitrospiraceae bacterium]|nr:DNA mismatch repair endonuclease MutL [Nitrospiraceae bacterium]